MITKSDVIVWFRALESYKRIDTMCTLLNMCLPFELRFLGTCLEELGRRDSQELRGMELRANNPQDLATDMIACQKGEPTDIKVRRKMALYLALIRACNRTCVTEIFRTLESWGELDFSNMTDIDTLKELLLVYTMAANHPVFEFEQHLKFMQIFEKIKENKLMTDPSPTSPSCSSTSSSAAAMHAAQAPLAAVFTPAHVGAGHMDSGLSLGLSAAHSTQQQLQHATSQQELMQQHAAIHAAMHPTAGQQSQQQHHHLLAPTHMQMLAQGANTSNMPLSYAQSHLTKVGGVVDRSSAGGLHNILYIPSLQLIPSAADGSALAAPHQIATVDGIQHMISSNITIPADGSAQHYITNDSSNAATILTHPNAASWAMRQYHHPTGSNTQSLLDHPPQASSPMLSQQSSPSSSRTTSPNRLSSDQQSMQPPQNMRSLQRAGGGGNLKHVRHDMSRPTAETTPPPPAGMSNSDIMLSTQGLKHISELPMSNDGMIGAGAGHQLQNLIRNGYTRSAAANHARLKSQQNYMPSHQHQQQQSPVNQQHYGQTFTTAGGITYAMQNMSMSSDMSSSGHSQSMMMDGGGSGSVLSMNSNKSTGSDSGSSIGSSGELSPPETPTLMMNSSGSGTTGNPTGSQPLQKLHQPSQLSYNKQIGLSRLNGRSDKLMSGNSAAVVSAGGNSQNAAALLYTQQQSQLQQQQTSQQTLYANEMLLGSNPNLAAMQNSLSNNNNNGGNASNVVSSNNNMVVGGGANTVLISSPSGGATSALGNVINSNSVILQTHPQQQQYNATYSYHAAAAAAVAAQQLAVASRPPMMAAHPSGMGPPPPHSTFRLPAGFQMPANGELLYPAYHPAGGITFLSGAAPPGSAPPPPPVTLRSTANSGAAVVSTHAVSQPPTPQQQQLPPLPTQQQLQQQSSAGASVLAPSPYSSLVGGVSTTTTASSTKNLSCYNCGSQTHSGRDCQEASMEDVTRSAIYKLDYSQAASGAGAGATAPSTTTTPPANQQSSTASSAADSLTASVLAAQHAQKSTSAQHDSSAVVVVGSSVTSSSAASAATAAAAASSSITSSSALTAVTAAAGAK